MKTKQISVFVDNRPGRLASVARALKEEGINIRAMSMADAPDFGIFRIIVEDPEHTRAVLKRNGFVTEVSSVIAVQVPDKPGGLAGVLDVFAEHQLNVEYMYAWLAGYDNKAVIFFRFEDTDRAIETLREAGISMVSAEGNWRAQ